MSLRGLSQVEPVSLVPDFVQHGSLSLVKSFSCLGFATPMLDFAKFGFFLLFQSLSYMGSSILAFGITKLDLLPFVSDAGAFESPPPPHASSRPGPALFVLDCAHLGPSLSPKNPLCAGLLTFVCGLSRFDFSVLALDSVQLGLLTLPHDCA